MSRYLPGGISHYHFDDESNLSLDDWFSKAVSDTKAITILDGSKRPTDIQAVATQRGIAQLKIVLVDCDHTERKRRLTKEKFQPELDVLDIYAWAAYLRGQADALGLEIIDTTHASVGESSARLLESIKHFAGEAMQNVAPADT